MTLKSTKVNPLVKENIEILKKKLGLKSESEVIQYLVLFYDKFWIDLHLASHQEMIKKVKDLHTQPTLF